MSNRNDPSRLLRYSLRANATFSMLSGGLFVATAGSLAAFLGLTEARQVGGLGANLIVFAILLLVLAAQRSIRLGLAGCVVAADVVWVVASAGVIVAGPLAAGANAAVALVASVVLLFAILQYAGIRRLRAVDPRPSMAV